MSSTPLSPAPVPPTRSRSIWWTDRRFWLGVSISVACLWLAFRNVRWAELAVAVRSVQWNLLALTSLLVLVDQFVRGVRWRVLLVPVGKVSVADSFSYLSIGALANALLPLRAGEIIRAILLGEKRNLSKSAVFATVVVERLLDVLMLVALSLVLLTLMPVPPVVKKTVLVFGVAGIGMLLAMWWVAGHLSQDRDSQLVDWSRALGRRVAGPPEQPRRVFGIDVSSLLRRGWAMVLSFAGGLSVVRSPRLAASAGLDTIISWGVSVVYIWLVMRACHLDLPWAASLMVLVIVNFGAAIPSSPGALGVAHVLAMLALTPWNVSQSSALTFAIMLHAVPFAVTIVVGMGCLWREGLQLGQLANAGEPLPAAVSHDQ